MTVQRLAVSAYRVPTDLQPESDGTAVWDSTTLVLVEVEAGGTRGTGWTYGSAAIARFIEERLRDIVEGCDAFANRAVWTAMNGRVRNDGRSGLASYAIAAVDVALWDLRARLLDAPLCDLFGSARACVPVYGSGGFTSYDLLTLQRQLAGWAADGMFAVKMKVGRDAAADPSRVAAARSAIGSGVGLFVDANGGYGVEQALAMAAIFEQSGVAWFEQPVEHNDLAGTRFVRDRAPAGMAISSGEYITDTAAAPAVADAVDVLQADATRCGGYTGFLAIDGYCDAARKPLSTHCSPMLHLHVAAASLRVRHMEYFHDHVRIEQMLFDGIVEPVGGQLRPDRSRPGHGLTFKHADAKKYEL
ncbi:MAG TPA: enolase C-terminal domain-like protein [Candidatus Tumulicola sp.]|jgi:L-alanine-DL-glutamate epimerase-like enolase superfamily enzyme